MAELSLAADERLRADGSHSIFWLDDDRILYVSFTREDLQKMAEKSFDPIRRVSPNQLRIVNVSTGQIQDHALASPNRGVCFSRGNLLYALPAPMISPANYVNGPLGGEKPVSAVGEKVSMRDCTEDQPYAAWKFVSWKGAYFDPRIGVRGQIPNDVAWRFPGQTSEWIEVPEGVWNDFPRTNAEFMASRIGLLIHVRRPVDRVFVLRGDLRGANPKFAAAETIYSGSVWRLAVSPNGCRLGLVPWADRAPTDDPGRLKVLQLCAEQQASNA